MKYLLYTKVVNITITLKRRIKMNATNIKEIDKLKSAIDIYCEEMIYHPFSEYRDCGCRIINAARIFYHNGLQILRNQTIADNNLTLNQNLEMLKEIKSILDITDSVQSKEQKIVKMLEKKKLKPEDFLYLDDWSNKPEFEISN